MSSPRGSRGRAVGLALLAALCSAMVAGCIRIPLEDLTIFGEQIAPKVPKASTPATSTPAPIWPALVGTPQSAGSWKATVIRAQPSATGPGGNKAPKGSSFLMIEVELKNVRMSEVILPDPKDFSLKSEAGKRLSPTGTDSGYNARGMRGISPGYGTTTVFAYKISKDSTGYMFTFAPKVSGKRVKLSWGVP